MHLAELWWAVGQRPRRCCTSCTGCCSCRAAQPLAARRADGQRQGQGQRGLWRGRPGGQLQRGLRGCSRRSWLSSGLHTSGAKWVGRQQVGCSRGAAGCWPRRRQCCRADRLWGADGGKFDGWHACGAAVRSAFRAIKQHDRHANMQHARHSSGLACGARRRGVRGREAPGGNDWHGSAVEGRPPERVRVAVAVGRQHAVARRRQKAWGRRRHRPRRRRWLQLQLRSPRALRLRRSLIHAACWCGVPSGGCSERGGCWGTRGEPPAAPRQRSRAHALPMLNGSMWGCQAPSPRI